MRVLFVSSANSSQGINPIVLRQQNSLIKKGISIENFFINGRGIRGFVKNKIRLSRKLKQNQFDIMHVHYGLWGLLLPLNCKEKKIVSLMGSDIFKSNILRLLIKFFSTHFWDQTIVKSPKMKETLRFEHAKVIPNGVSFELFKPMDKIEARRFLKLEENKKYILFVSVFHRANPSKNIALAKKAVDLIKNNDIELLQIYDVRDNEMKYYYAASDLLLMTSRYEGSPNAIKEAMACNLPIVSTDVGDVKEVIKNTEGCFIASFDPDDVANKINMAIEFGEKTNGRENIRHLEESVIADKIIDVYATCLKNKNNN